jgi:hypothetical protein
MTHFRRSFFCATAKSLKQEESQKNSPFYAKTHDSGKWQKSSF